MSVNQKLAILWLRALRTFYWLDWKVFFGTTMIRLHARLHFLLWRDRVVKWWSK